jgi:hypothetical protein
MYQMTDEILQGTYTFKVQARNWVGNSPESSPYEVAVPWRTDQEKTLITIAGTTDVEGEFQAVEAAVVTTVSVTAYDESDALRTTGGDFYFLHVENLCYVVENYRCDKSRDGDEYTELPIFDLMADTSDGTYTAKYVIDRVGRVTVSVVLARRGGLYAEYFNNAFLEGEPVISRVDNAINFDKSDGLITNESGDFVSIHWYGKLLAPATEDFTFILNGDDGFRFYLQGILLVDRWNSCCD